MADGPPAESTSENTSEPGQRAERPGPLRSLPRLDTWPRRLVLAALVLQLLYLIAGNAFLNTDLGLAIMNRKPDKVSVAFDSAWTPLPGVVRLRALDLEGSTRRVHWSTTIERGWALIWVPSLALKHFRVVRGTETGVEVAIDILPKPDEPKPRKKGRGWKITLGGLRVDELARVRVNDNEIDAAGKARGWVQFQVRGPMELDIDLLEFDDGVINSGGEEVASQLQFTGHFETEPLRVTQKTLDELLAGTSGRIELDAEVESLGFLDAYLRKISWLRLDGSGALALDLGVQAGRIQPESSLTLIGREVVADFFDLRARGHGRVDGVLRSSSDGIQLAAELPEFSIARSSDSAMMLVGEELEARFDIDTVALYEPPRDTAGSIRLAAARADDLSRFGPYFPGGLPLDLGGGTAELSADLAFDTEARSGDGNLAVDVDGVSGTFGDATFATSGAIDVEIPRLDLVAGHYDLSGSKIELERGTFTHRGKIRSENWSGRLDIPSGSLEMPPRPDLEKAGDGDDPESPRPLEIQADVEIWMSDTGPVVAFMEQRLPKLRFIDGLLTIADVELTGSVIASQGVFGLHTIELTGGKDDQLSIRMDLDVDGSATSGVAFARYRALAASVTLENGERDWGIRHPERQYEEGLAERQAQRQVTSGRATSDQAKSESAAGSGDRPDPE